MKTETGQSGEFCGDPRPTEELIRFVLTLDIDEVGDDYWPPVWSLQHRLPDIFGRVRELAKSPVDRERDLAATLFGQNGVSEKDRPLVDQCLGLLELRLQEESSPAVLASVIHAIGHLHPPREVEVLVPFAAHADPDVRFAVAQCLCGHDNDLAIRTLIGLTTDPDSDVRDWSTFALGSLTGRDTPEIRDTLFARVNDPDADTRCEAYVGLAQRGDPRLAPPFLQELETTAIGTLQDWRLIGETADHIADHAARSAAPHWLPVLAKLKTLGLGDPAKVQAALARYPSAHPATP